MADAIKEQFTGQWTHIQDDHMPPFFDAVGLLEEEKQYLLTCHPQIAFSVKGDTITSTNTPNPDKEPDRKADVTFKLGEEFQFQAEGHLLKVTAEWKDNRLVQQLEPINSHLAPHTIELYLDRNKDLVQAYKVINSSGHEVMGSRRYEKT